MTEKEFRAKLNTAHIRYQQAKYFECIRGLNKLINECERRIAIMDKRS